ncbi:uncharacterized protein LOC104898868 [Beta vulgaris subsp. vulgaris]|uniref:uncharacterized protein LOC104898868 n=1 Tax=Beta vulgaris subsp. vulgaris TaxID=3555 RepID=UPI00053FE940|nr:uncharacterized protein LOC104898868 [Beta vulgaris subsp. vulgaris]
MAKGSKKGNGGKKAKQHVKVVKKPQSGDAKKKVSVNDIHDNASLSWSSKEEQDNDSVASADLNASMMEKASAEVARQQMAKWIESIRTPLRPASGNVVNPSPHPMQQLASTTVILTEEDVKEEIAFWESAVVCYILGIKPPARIVDGFIRRVWGKCGIDRIAMGSNGVFVVRFRTMEGKQKAIDAGPILYDSLPVIVKNWSPELDLMAEEVKVVPTWVRLPGLPLKYWGPSSLNKISSLIGKSIRIDRATA